MANRKSRAKTRSGYLCRGVERRSFASLVEWATAPVQQDQPELLRSKCKEFIDSWERFAFYYYRKNGLPDHFGSYTCDDEGQWRELKNGELANRYINVTTLAKWWPDDSDVGFATEILKGCINARRLLEKGSKSELAAFANAALLSQNVEALSLEYGMADILGPAIPQKKGRSDGGVVRAAQVRADRALAHSQLQQWATEIWREDPRRTKSAVARLVISRHRRRENFTETFNTIRQVIKKPAGLLSTPSD